MFSNLEISSANRQVFEDTAVDFCNEFLSGKFPRFVLGTNDWAESIASAIAVDGFIDDFSKAKEFTNKPVCSFSDLPADSLIVSSVVLGRPISGLQRILDSGFKGLDYYSFKKFSGLPLKSVLYLDSFERNFDQYQHPLEWLYHQLDDDESKRILKSIVYFRYSHNLEFMKGFSDIQYRQYFDSCLDLSAGNQVFLDVGSFDGYTSEEFIKRYPGYKRIYAFEPIPVNMSNVRKRLSDRRDIIFFPFGCSDQSCVVRFKSHGSSSSVSDDGDIEVELKTIDDVVQESFTFLKMDIEGGERDALLGARESIIKYHPTLAICVYHREDDLWKIPELVFSFRNDYKIYLRHYTEGVTETVMFFVPRSS